MKIIPVVKEYKERLEKKEIKWRRSWKKNGFIRNFSAACQVNFINLELST